MLPLMLSAFKGCRRSYLEGDVPCWQALALEVLDLDLRKDEDNGQSS
jgi:hypothetical protein